jgi:uncharacterized protein
MNTAQALPVSGDRIAVVDVLRAFALFGIIVTHAEMGFLAGPPPGPDFMMFGTADGVVHQWVAMLVESKFFSIFAFLFGLSFAIQLDRSAQKGTAFAGRFAWRLVLLLLIGMAHQLLFNGDVLMLYAVLGLLLLPMRKVRSGILLVVALVLLLNVPGVLFGLSRMNAPPPTPEQQQANAKIGEVFAAGGKALHATADSGSLADVAQANYVYGLGMKTFYLLFTGRLWITFGCFLLGMCAGRANLFRESDSSRRFFGRLLVAAGAVALVTTAATWSVEALDPFSNIWMTLASTVQKATLAATYVAAVTLLYWRYANGVLAQLAPLGKMGLTTYLLQSVFLAFVFYGAGLGMMGEIGHAAAAGVGVGFFVVQIFFARWWLTKMTMGPVEWLWRSATQLRWEPFRKIAATPAPVPQVTPAG